MDISYLGHSSFKIRGKGATLITDPYNETAVGLKFPRHTAADIITVSHEHEDHNATQIIEGSPFIVRGPGEYEVKGVSIIGTPTFHDTEKGAERGTNTIYHIEVDGVGIVHLGDLGHMLTSAEVESLDGVDVLLIPVGGVYTIDAATASKLVHEIEPSVVIPMHFGTPNLSPRLSQLSPVSAFLKEMGKEGIMPQAKLSLTKDKIPEEMQVVLLE